MVTRVFATVRLWSQVAPRLRFKYCFKSANYARNDEKLYPLIFLLRITPIDPLEDSLPDLPVQGFTLTCLHLCRQKLFQVVPTSANLLCTSEATKLCNPHLAPFAFGMDNRSHLQMLSSRWQCSENDDNVAKPKIAYREIDDNVLSMTSTSSFHHNPPPPHFNHTTNRWQCYETDDNVVKTMTMLWNRLLHIMKSMNGSRNGRNRAYTCARNTENVTKCERLHGCENPCHQKQGGWNWFMVTFLGLWHRAWMIQCRT